MKWAGIGLFVFIFLCMAVFISWCIWIGLQLINF